jgi:hypothetical protein
MARTCERSGSATRLSHALLERFECSRETRAVQCRCEAAHELGERPYVDGVIDVHDAEHGIGGTVDRRDRAGHRMADDHGPFDPEIVEERVHEVGNLRH